MSLPQPVRRHGLRVAAGGAAMIGLASLLALPSAAAPDFKAQFAKLDTNGDGVISVEEFLAAKSAKNPQTTQSITIQTHSSDDKTPPATVTLKPGTSSQAYSFWLPDELKTGDGATGEGPREMRIITRSNVKVTSTDGAAAPIETKMFVNIDDIRKEEFNDIDVNKDGKVSLEEYQAHQTALLTRGFEMLDTNGDKSLSEAEYAKIAGPPQIRIVTSGAGAPVDMPKIDIPGLKTPAPEAIKAAFAKLDANHDGKLSLQEYLPKS